MAHAHQLKFVESTAKLLKIDEHSGLAVLEVGSFIVNDTIRPFFPNSSYVGVDLIEGPGVDLISNGIDIDLPDKSVDVSISCECFEHNPHWEKAFMNMHRIAKDGGIVIFSCASRGRFEHGTTRTDNSISSPGTKSWDYYKNLNQKDFEKAFNLESMFSKHLFQCNDASHDLYFIGKKLGMNSVSIDFNEAEMIKNLKNVKDPNKTHGKFTPNKIILGLASYLPDEMFQNFVIKYFKFKNGLYKIIRPSRVR
jgi:SAM-dependent methyltransferase